MTKTLLITIILLTFSTTFAQNTINNLLSKLKIATPEEKIQIYNKLCWKLRSDNPDSAIFYGEKAIALAKKLNKQNYIPESYNFLGVVYRNKGQYIKALTYYNDALKLAQILKDSAEIAYSYNNIGGIYRILGNGILALENTLKALKYFESQKNESGIAFSTINLGIIYFNEKDYVNALKYLKYTLKIREKLGYKKGIALTLNQIAIVYYALKKYNKSLQYYNELSKLYKKIGDKKGIASTLEGYSDISYYQHFYYKALQSLKKSLAINKEIENKAGVYRNLLKLGIIYAKLNMVKTAFEKINEAKKIGRELNSLQFLLYEYKYLSEFYEAIGKYKLALKNYKSYSSLRDSIYSKENLQMIANIQTGYELEKKGKENQILEKENQVRITERNYLIAITVLVLFLIAILSYRYRTNKKLNKKLFEANLTKDKFLSILAHDLKNPFNTTLGYLQILLEDFDDLDTPGKYELIKNTYESSQRNLALLENLLSWARAQGDRIEFLPKLIDIRQVTNEIISIFKQSAKNKQIKLKNNITVKIYAFADEQMVKTILRNLINNAIKFTHNGGSVSISCESMKDQIKICASDTGVGIAQEDIEKIFKIDVKHSTLGTANEIGTGLGLILCKEFIEINSGKLTIESTQNKGSIFSFTLPANS
ncbi:non-motile and phage-resistance protein [bacterium BMS3Abin04]|nr:non-motile and phage-resistance protein [bacterium BMS3Abin04]